MKPAPSLHDLGRMPALDERMETLFDWLASRGLVTEGGTMDVRRVDLAGRLRLYSPEVLMHLVLFEVFNHEFFHHLAESTATSLEILAAARGEIEAVYLSYCADARENAYADPHAPLEEALANASAYYALGFVSRIKAGYKTAVVKSY